MGATEIGKGVVAVTFDAEKGVADASKTVNAAMGKLASDTARVFAAVKLFDFAKAGFSELKQAQAVTAQTETLLRNLGSTAGVTEGEVKSLAEAQLKLSGVDDEVAQSAENVLLRMGVTGETFKETTGLSNDLAVSMGTDMVSSAELLGKALAHPEMAARLLKPAIGGLTDAQLASIKAFQATGDVAAEQGVILDAVREKVGGAAKAYGETLPGQVDIANESIHNAEGALMAGLAPALKFTATGATFLATEVGKLPEPLQATIGAVGLVGGAVVSLARPVRDIAELYGKWKTAREAATVADTAGTAADAKLAVTASAAGTAVEGEAVALESEAVAAGEAAVATEAASASNAGLLATLGPIGIAAAAAGAAIYGFSHQTSISVDAQKAASQTTSELVDQYHHFGDVTKIWTELGDKSLGTLIRLRDALRANGESTADLDRIIADETGAQQQANSDAQAGADAVGDLTDAKTDLAAETQRVIDKVNAETKAYQDNYDRTNALVDASIGFSQAQQRVLADVQNATTAVDDQKTAQDETVVASDQAKSSIEALGKAAVQQYDDMAGSAATTQGRIDQQRGALEQVAATLDPSSDLAVWLKAYIASLNTIPSHVSTVLDIYSHIIGGGGSGITQYSGKGGPIKSAAGFHGWVPATPGGQDFTVAEAGQAEYVDVTPASEMRGGSHGMSGVHLWGDVNIYADSYEGGQAAASGFLDMVERRQVEELTRAAVG